MLNIVLFGPPGAGKGTQSQKLIDKYGLVHLSTGDILRSEIARGTSLGMAAKEIMDKGELVSDEIVIGMIESKLDANSSANGFIFDGFPRTQAQAVALDDLLQKKGTAISAMLALEVNDEELIKRLLLRGQESGRPDDQNEEIIRNRVNEYNTKTLPLKEYYSEQGKFHSINGIGSIDSIFAELCDRITFVQAEMDLTMLENDIEHLDMTVNDFEEATEISPELQKDMDEVRAETAEEKPAKKEEKTEEAPKVSSVTSKSSTTKPSATKAKATKKTAPKKAVKKAAPEKAAKKPASKSATAKAPATKAKATKKTTPKKAVKKAAPKKAAKKATPKKVVKKAAPTKVAKKTVKKVAPKKAVKKATPKKAAKKVAPKKAVKKATPKKAVKKTAPKKATKKVAPKKAVKKAAPKVVKKEAPKKAVKKSAPKKAAPKKAVKKNTSKKKK